MKSKPISYLGSLCNLLEVSIKMLECCEKDIAQTIAAALADGLI